MEREYGYIRDITINEIVEIIRIIYYNQDKPAEEIKELIWSELLKYHNYSEKNKKSQLLNYTLTLKGIQVINEDLSLTDIGKILYNKYKINYNEFLAELRSVFLFKANFIYFLFAINSVNEELNYPVKKDEYFNLIISKYKEIRKNSTKDFKTIKRDLVSIIRILKDLMLLERQKNIKNYYYILINKVIINISTNLLNSEEKRQLEDFIFKIQNTTTIDKKNFSLEEEKMDNNRLEEKNIEFFKLVKDLNLVNKILEYINRNIFITKKELFEIISENNQKTFYNDYYSFLMNLDIIFEFEEFIFLTKSGINFLNLNFNNFNFKNEIVSNIPQFYRNLEVLLDNEIDNTYSDLYENQITTYKFYKTLIDSQEYRYHIYEITQELKKIELRNIICYRSWNYELNFTTGIKRFDITINDRIKEYLNKNMEYPIRINGFSLIFGKILYSSFPFIQEFELNKFIVLYLLILANLYDCGINIGKLESYLKLDNLNLNFPETLKLILNILNNYGIETNLAKEDNLLSLKRCNIDIVFNKNQLDMIISKYNEKFIGSNKKLEIFFPLNSNIIRNKNINKLYTELIDNELFLDLDLDENLINRKPSITLYKQNEVLSNYNFSNFEDLSKSIISTNKQKSYYILNIFSNIENFDDFINCILEIKKYIKNLIIYDKRFDKNFINIFYPESRNQIIRYLYHIRNVPFIGTIPLFDLNMENFKNNELVISKIFELYKNFINFSQINFDLFIFGFIYYTNLLLRIFLNLLILIDDLKIKNEDINIIENEEEKSIFIMYQGNRSEVFELIYKMIKKYGYKFWNDNSLEEKKNYMTIKNISNLLVSFKIIDRRYQLTNFFKDELSKNDSLFIQNNEKQIRIHLRTLLKQ
ncbi:MAG: hypothetical protein ACTSVV_16265 [Promethearchaeota archaeon]